MLVLSPFSEWATILPPPSYPYSYSYSYSVEYEHEHEQEQDAPRLTPPPPPGTIHSSDVTEEREMGHPRYTKEEIAARGQAIYDQQIRPQVEPAQNGKYLVINIETGDYELDADDLAVSQRAYARFPGAPLFGMRIGSPVWGRIGLGGARAAG